jgi:hypothetical protein
MTDGPPVPPKPTARTTKAAPRKAAPKAAKPAAEVTQVDPEEPPATNGRQQQQQQFERFEPWKPTGASWREDALARIAELESLAILLRRRSTQDTRSADDLLTVAREHLKVARTAAEDRPGALRGSSGANVTRVVSNIHVAETALLRLAPDDYVLGQIPTIHAYVIENLGPKDTRRTQLRELTSVDHAPLTETQRVKLVSAVREANSEARKKVARVRSFRNVLLMTAGFMLLGALAVAGLGMVDQTAVPLCFTPDTRVVCATQQSPIPKSGDVDAVISSTSTPYDLALIELVGMLAAAVAAAAALRKIKGTSTPFSLPIALAVLRLPTGALTAFLGLLLMRGGFVPGLSDLDSPEQILAWAVIFGYAQELFTRLVDNQANTVLNDIGSTSPTAQAPAASA